MVLVRWYGGVVWGCDARNVIGPLALSCGRGEIMPGEHVNW